MVRQGILPSSAVSQTKKSPPVKVSRKKAKAAVPWPSKKPAVSSSPVFQTTKAIQSPGTVSQKWAEAAVSKIPAFSSQVRPNSGFQTAHSESTQGVLGKSRAVAVEPEDGGVTVMSSNPKVLGILPRIEVEL